MKTQPHAWIFSDWFDTVFILFPPFVVTLLCVLFQEPLSQLQDIPWWLWLILIVGIDVCHVYSTLFRTYFDRNELEKRPRLYSLTPLLAWLIGCLLYHFGSFVFWKATAYLAVFHFIRQQYGFMMIYGRQDKSSLVSKRIDQLAIYSATLYPLIYWHLNSRKFHWFIEGDFFSFSSPKLMTFASLIYGLTLTFYAAKEFWFWHRHRRLNFPKNMLLIGTVLSWLVGIVTFNNDLTFTATNVITHGIPYLALIWIYGYNQNAMNQNRSSYFTPWLGRLFDPKLCVLYLAFLFGFALIEEGLWDGFIWRDHQNLFGWWMKFPFIQDHTTLTWLVPLLALPQITHYVLDAFIWRLKPCNHEWKKTLFFQNEKI